MADSGSPSVDPAELPDLVDKDSIADHRHAPRDAPHEQRRRADVADATAALPCGHSLTSKAKGRSLPGVPQNGLPLSTRS